MKRGLQKLFFITVMAASSLYMASCVDEGFNLDDDNINTDINIGGDNLTVSIGQTKVTYIKDLLNFETVPQSKAYGVSTVDGVHEKSNGDYYYQFTMNIPSRNVAIVPEVTENFNIVLPDFLKNSVGDLDIKNTSIEATLGISPQLPNDVSAKFEITANKSGVNPVVVSSGNVIVPKSGGVFWVAGDNTDMPTGATHVDFDMATIVNMVPESLGAKISFTGITAPNANVATDLVIRIPFAMGEKTKFETEFDERISLGSVAEYINDEFILQVDAIENTIPFNLVLGAVLYDSNDKIVTGVSSTTEGALSGKGSTMTIKIKETTEGALENVSYLRLKLSVSVTAGDIAVLNKNQMVQLGLKVKIPGGINLEL